MIKSNWSGLDKLQRKLKNLEKTQNVPFHKIFNSSFMERHTQHCNIDEFFKAGGFEFETEEEFEKILENELDQHVRESTIFKSWREMLNKAGEHYVAKQLGI